MISDGSSAPILIKMYTVLDRMGFFNIGNFQLKSLSLSRDILNESDFHDLTAVLRYCLTEVLLYFLFSIVTSAECFGIYLCIYTSNVLHMDRKRTLLREREGFPNARDHGGEW